MGCPAGVHRRGAGSHPARAADRVHRAARPGLCLLRCRAARVAPRPASLAARPLALPAAAAGAAGG
ncbi:thiamine pyrophosphate enzyme, central domain protein, partial [Bordetella hinzii L60]